MVDSKSCLDFFAEIQKMQILVATVALCSFGHARNGIRGAHKPDTVCKKYGLHSKVCLAHIMIPVFVNRRR
jgi:hypothetical protein